MPKGDILLITFPFTDLSGSKLRPVITLAESPLDLTVCFITTQIEWQEKADIILTPSKLNGLKKQSLVRISKIATLDKGLLGKLSKQEMELLDEKLKILFQIDK